MSAPAMPPLLALSLLFAAGPTLASDAAILQCRTLSDAQARLACYDGIPLGAQPAVAASPAAASPAPSPQQNFGMEAAKRQEAEPTSIESTIEGKFDGWDPGAQIRLANGQVWRVVDGSSAVLPGMKNPKVKVVRNLLGTIFLEIEGTNNSPKVRRVR
jgi:hypothetical protein